ncbi:hypothetical protein [Ulvibacterium sp.]|uniref:nSTAND3 domain-containing NTPase n=1 Tax=Ulvibacterium sp. TaxID=2665914 RepID=UPI0026109D26|nr:hypothetical protein [Ulvibacterium sp.]
MNYKYNIENLDWQQFELLSFKCLQVDVSKSIEPMEGGNDKGREFVYEGVTNFFSSDGKTRKYIFQSKHKSKLDFNSLKQDLKSELDKVYLKNKLVSDIYCLVTNISLTGNQHDDLSEIFNNFVLNNELQFKLEFKIYSYRHFESCIDNNDEIKILFPAIIKNADFKILLDRIINKVEENNSRSFVHLFEKNRTRFVYTSIFNNALEKIENNNILLLSGPPKSGKTFTAEMIIFNKHFLEEFIPYNIIDIHDFDRFYDTSKKQIFLFDDTFGKYELDFNRADLINRKLEFIFDLSDNNHKFIFTSREYIFRAFINYSDKEIKSIIERINVDVNMLSQIEKESIFFRYFKLNTGLSDIKFDLAPLINKANFTPEVVRSYFENNKDFDYTEFLKHVDFPDNYLKKIFINLDDNKKILLLSIFLSSNKRIESIAYCYNYIHEDLDAPKKLILINEELELLRGSLLSNIMGRYWFYHPSMAEFFIQYINQDLLSYRNILFKNINTDLLFMSGFRKSYGKSKISIEEEDVSNLTIGFERFISNPSVDLNNINGVFSWLKEPDRSVFFQVNYNLKYKDILESMLESLKKKSLKNMADDSMDLLGTFFKNVRGIFFNENLGFKTFFKQDELGHILRKNRGKERFWFLVFSIMPFLHEKLIFNENYIGRNWLNIFYKELKRDVNTLGHELYGNAYPEFIEPSRYKKLMEEKKLVEANKIKMRSKADYKQNTSRTWYKRYMNCKEKMMLVKSIHPHGYTIYEKLIPFFSHLSILEENQKNRYIYNSKKNWW